MTKILITGAAGFIGSHLCEHLLRTTDVEVIGIDDLSAGSLNHVQIAQTFAPRFRFYKYRLGTNTYWLDDTSSMWRDLRKFDGAVLLAARVGVKVAIEKGVDVLLDNHKALEESIDILQRASHPRFVYASSSEVYGDSEVQPVSESMPLRLPCPTDSRWGYAYEKAYAEAQLLGLSKRGQANAVVARFFNTVGARQNRNYGAVLPAVVQAVASNQPATVHVDAEGLAPTRSFIHVEDTCAAITTLLQGGQVGEVYNVGAGQELSIRELVAVVARTLRGVDAWPIQEVPVGEALMGCRRRVPVVKKLEGLGWRAEKTLEDAVRELAAETR